jgi:MFS family permease
MRFKINKQLWVFFSGFFLQALPGAMLVPLLTLGLAARGVGATLIGALATLGSLAYIAALPAAPALIGRLGARTTQRLAMSLRTVAVVGLTTSDWPVLMVALYAVMGFAAGLTYTIADMWVPALARDGQSGRTLALFQTIVGAAAFLGAGLVLLTGVAGPAPRVVAVAAMLLGQAVLWRLEDPASDGRRKPALPSLVVGRRSSHPSRDFRTAQPGAGSPWVALRGMVAQVGPAVLAAALMGGIFEGGLAVALPLYGLAVGAGPALAAGLATALGLGSLAQYPFGALADRWPWQRVAVGTAGAIAASALLLPLAPHWPWLLLPLGVAWGSAGGGLYTLATIRNAARYSGVSLVGISVVSQLAYMVGEAAGPTVGGLAIDLEPQYGLPALVGGVAFMGFLTLLGSAGWHEKAAESVRRKLPVAAYDAPKSSSQIAPPGLNSST